MAGIKKYLVVFSLLAANICLSQIKAGKIIYERRTNLEKELGDDDEYMQDILKKNKFKIDSFELVFNDSISLFKPIISDEVDKLSWTTSKNITYQNYKTEERMVVLSMYGQELYVSDSIHHRTWKLTDSKRVIGKYECRKAIWQKNDSTRIYAWYSPEIVPSVGPEGFTDLPGAVLGLATEDGGIIYFARTVEIMKPEPTLFVIETKRKKIFTGQEMKTKLFDDYGKDDWGKRMLEKLMRWY